jgi:hypothetical protein
MYETLQYIATFVSILGGLFVMSRLVSFRLYGFGIWCISNSLWMLFGFLTGAVGLMATFTFYFFENLYGIYHNMGCHTVEITDEKLEELVNASRDIRWAKDREKLKEAMRNILCDKGNLNV